MKANTANLKSFVVWPLGQINLQRTILAKSKLLAIEKSGFPIASNDLLVSDGKNAWQFYYDIEQKKIAQFGSAIAATRSKPKSPRKPGPKAKL